MKLHEAMLKGREMFPEAKQNTDAELIVVVNGEIKEFCALGACYLGAIGKTKAKNKFKKFTGEFKCYLDIEKIFPELNDSYVKDDTLESYIWELNDNDKLSIKEIAEKVKEIYE